MRCTLDFASVPEERHELEPGWVWVRAERVQTQLQVMVRFDGLYLSVTGVEGLIVPGLMWLSNDVACMQQLNQPIKLTFGPLSPISYKREFVNQLS